MIEPALKYAKRGLRKAMLKKINMEEFKKRASKYSGLYEFEDWKFKIYHILYDEERVIEDVEKAIKSKLPHLIKEKTDINPYPNYKIGTVIIHEAKDCVFTLVNWWVYENVLQHHVFYSEFDSPSDIVDYSDKGIQFCVWDLGILWYERNLWVETILKNSKKPDWDAYLNSHYQSNFIE